MYKLMAKRGLTSAKLFCVVLLAVVGNACSQSNPVNAQWQGIDGQTIDLEAYRGQWVVINYWATWCPPCVAEMPELQTFHDKHQDDAQSKVKAVVLGINYEEPNVTKIEAFADNYFINFPLAFANNLEGKTPFGQLVGLPSTYVLDPKGQLVYQRAGPVTESLLEDVINESAS